MENTVHNGISPKFWMYDVPVSFDDDLVITEFGWHRPIPWRLSKKRATITL
ncbi:MAG: hypothetical protein ACLUSP_06825 [Christensenellales bacterium]